MDTYMDTHHAEARGIVDTHSTCNWAAAALLTGTAMHGSSSRTRLPHEHVPAQQQCYQPANSTPVSYIIITIVCKLSSAIPVIVAKQVSTNKRHESDCKLRENEVPSTGTRIGTAKCMSGYILMSQALCLLRHSPEVRAVGISH
jgi:hypothetical protein